MDFQKMNSLNVYLNLLSGNLLPMTANSSFPILWKIYSVFVWLLEFIYTGALIFGCFCVSLEKALNDGLLSIIVALEGIFMVARIQAQRELVQHLIQKLNNILHVEDEAMKKIIAVNLKPMEIPFRLYLAGGSLSVFLFCCITLPLAAKKDIFFYEDYKMPVTFSKEPFSTDIFLLGSIILLISNMYIFFKKVGVDVYMTYLVALVTAQYQYIAFKLVSIFQDSDHPQYSNGNSRENNFKTDLFAEKEIRSLCRHHNSITRITLMLKKLLSLNFSLIYINNVFRFCFLGIMLTKISSSLLEGFMVFMYGTGAMLQFYILCSCVQKLVEASMEITDKAFHEDWYRFNISIKRTFMLVIMASNLELKLSTFGKFNLSLPSFMAVLNQSYSIAILLLKIK
ncbi:Odorant receptor 240 [Nylanderia fulva]|uniref:Odorant receptor n=2 Tax=Nylanderia fulva TaxID=613905 RepID=A0A6G1LPS3_9HYME|nr:Odorant receptor 240 [Nylanderia fulva]